MKAVKELIEENREAILSAETTGELWLLPESIGCAPPRRWMRAVEEIEAIGDLDYYNPKPKSFQGLSPSEIRKITTNFAFDPPIEAIVDAFRGVVTFVDSAGSYVHCPVHTSPSLNKKTEGECVYRIYMMLAAHLMRWTHYDGSKYFRLS